jgi:hypothetical protein
MQAMHRDYTGKSWFARYLVACNEAVIFTSGKMSDISHAYAMEHMTQADKIDHVYSLIENLKTGIMFSPEYDSGTKIFKPSHVIVFANFFPDERHQSGPREVPIKDAGNNQRHIRLCGGRRRRGGPCGCRSRRFAGGQAAEDAFLLQGVSKRDLALDDVIRLEGGGWGPGLPTTVGVATTCSAMEILQVVAYLAREVLCTTTRVVARSGFHFHDLGRRRGLLDKLIGLNAWCNGTVLRLKSCGLGEVKGRALAEALRLNTTLTLLDLGGNGLGRGRRAGAGRDTLPQHRAYVDRPWRKLHGERAEGRHNLPDEAKRRWQHVSGASGTRLVADVRIQ